VEEQLRKPFNGERQHVVEEIRTSWKVQFNFMSCR